MALESIAEQQLSQLLNSINLPDDILHNPLIITSDLESRLISWFDMEFQGNLEITAKQIIYKTSFEEDHTKLSIFSLLLDVIYQLSQLEKCELPLVHILLEEIMDTEPISWCQQFWSYLQPREHQIASNLSGVRAPGITLIRMCNSLVRRLSKTSDAQFSGRIAMFLARAFPLSEKSGLNMRGSYNLDNVTLYNKVEDKIMKNTETSIESAETPSEDTKPSRESTPADRKETPKDLDVEYETFWSLQDYFRDPTQLLSDEGLSIYRVKAQKVLQILKANESKNFGNPRENATEMNGIENHKIETTTDQQFVAKWLTSPDLFELELKDQSFRFTVYAQMFIICEFVLGLTESSKQKWIEIGAKNSSVMYSYTTSAEDAKVFKELEDDILRSAGPVLRDTLVHITKMDRLWQDWKLKNCPAFPEGTMTLTGFDKAEQTFKTLKEPRKKFWHSMGTAPLSRLWKTVTGLDKLKNPNDTSIPDPKEYLDRISCLSEKTVREEIQEIEKVENGDKDVTNGTIKAKIQAEAGEIELLTWQGLRAARDKGQWSIFNRVDHAKGFAGLFENSADESSEEEEEEDAAEVAEDENVKLQGNEKEAEIKEEEQEVKEKIEDEEMKDEKEGVEEASEEKQKRELEDEQSKEIRTAVEIEEEAVQDAGKDQVQNGIDAVGENFEDEKSSRADTSGEKTIEKDDSNEPEDNTVEASADDVDPNIIDTEMVDAKPIEEAVAAFEESVNSAAEEERTEKSTTQSPSITEEPSAAEDLLVSETGSAAKSPPIEESAIEQSSAAEPSPETEPSAVDTEAETGEKSSTKPTSSKKKSRKASVRDEENEPTGRKTRSKRLRSQETEETP